MHPCTDIHVDLPFNEHLPPISTETYTLTPAKLPSPVAIEMYSLTFDRSTIQNGKQEFRRTDFDSRLVGAEGEGCSEGEGCV